MFYQNVNPFPSIMNKVSIKACSGGIYKSHPKSRIVSMHINSNAADYIFSDNPMYGEKM